MMMVSRISIKPFKSYSFLTLLGFNQCSVSRLGYAWVAFLLIGVALPVVVLEISNCPGCDKFQIKSLELDIIASLACLAAVLLFCVLFNLRKYGFRKFLFVDRFSGQMERFSKYYIQSISDAEVPWHLIVIAIFFTLIKLPGPYYPYWGCILVPHFANGGLRRTLWFAVLWYRTPKKTAGPSVLANESLPEQTDV